MLRYGTLQPGFVVVYHFSAKCPLVKRLGLPQGAALPTGPPAIVTPKMDAWQQADLEEHSKTFPTDGFEPTFNNKRF